MNWKINFVERSKLNNFILQVIWDCNNEQDDYVGRLTGSIGFEVKEPQIAFDQVTETMIVEWVKKELGDYEVAKIEQSVQSMIDANITNNKVVGTPWVN
jgi:predicted sugar kinase